MVTKHLIKSLNVTEVKVGDPIVRMIFIVTPPPAGC